MHMQSLGRMLKPGVALAKILRGDGVPLGPWARYTLAIVLCALALAARSLMMPLDAGLAFLTFYPAVIIAALMFGPGPGMLAVALSGVVADYFFLPPYASFAVSPKHLLPLATFALTGGLTCFLVYGIRYAASELRDSEQRLRGLYEAPHVGIALTDMTGRYLQFNDAFREICGYSAEELRDLDYWALTPTKYRAEEAKQLESLQRTGRYGPYEKEYVRKDGRLIPLQLNGALLMGRDGQPYIWSIVEDITERKKLEAQLAAEANRNRLFLRMASDGVHILNATGRVIEVSDSFCEMLGYARDEVIGMHPSQWDVHQTDNEYRATLSRQLNGTLKRFTTRYRRKDGTLFDVELHVERFDLNGEPHLFCSARDVTEQKQLERAVLEVADAEQRRIGHDLHDGLGQELTGISMLAGALAAAEKKAGRPDVDGITQIEKLTRRAIGTCRAIARGLAPLGYAKAGLVEALEEMVSLQRDTFGGDLRFKTVAASPLRLGTDVSDHVYRIAQEAITNALRHGKAHVIEVTLEIQPTTVRIEIADDGVGMGMTSASSGGMGLRIMRYRASMIGADLKVGPRDHGGTRVTCECPQPAAADAISLPGRFAGT